MIDHLVRSLIAHLYCTADRVVKRISCSPSSHVTIPGFWFEKIGYRSEEGPHQQFAASAINDLLHPTSRHERLQNGSNDQKRSAVHPYLDGHASCVSPKFYAFKNVSSRNICSSSLRVWLLSHPNKLVKSTRMQSGSPLPFMHNITFSRFLSHLFLEFRSWFIRPLHLSLHLSGTDSGSWARSRYDNRSGLSTDLVCLLRYRW